MTHSSDGHRKGKLGPSGFGFDLWLLNFKALQVRIEILVACIIVSVTMENCLRHG